MKLLRLSFFPMFCYFGVSYMNHVMHLQHCPYPQNVYVFLNLFPSLFAVILAIVLVTSQGTASYEMSAEDYLIFHIILVTVIADTFLIIINKEDPNFLRDAYFVKSLGFYRIVAAVAYLGMRKIVGGINFFHSESD